MGQLADSSRLHERGIAVMASDTAAQGEIMATYGDEILRRCDVATLDDGSWLNDQVISFYLAYLHGESLAVRVHSTSRGSVYTHAGASSCQGLVGGRVPAPKFGVFARSLRRCACVQPSRMPQCSSSVLPPGAVEAAAIVAPLGLAEVSTS